LRPAARHPALAAAPNGFTVTDFTAKLHALTGVGHRGYSIRQAGHDLASYAANSSSTNPAETAATTSRRWPARTITALLTLRYQVIAPILAAVRSPRMERKPAHWTRVDRDYEKIRIDTQPFSPTSPSKHR
jgi:hypothetical protein